MRLQSGNGLNIKCKMKFHIYKSFTLIYTFKVLDELLFHFRSVFMLLGPFLQTVLSYFKITFVNFNENTCKTSFIGYLYNFCIIYLNWICLIDKTILYF